MPLYKKTSKDGALAFGAWHPNFRNTAELPDTKAVRTKFFINSGAVVLAVAALTFWLYTEYTIRNLETELQNWNAQIARDTKPSEAAVALYKNFKAEEAKTTEVVGFVNSNKVVLSDFIASLATTLPEYVSISSIQYRDGDIAIKGLIKRPPEVATEIASSYEKALQKSKDYGDNFAISLTNLSPVTGTEGLSFDISMKAKK